MIFGTTSTGGQNYQGTIYQYIASTNTFTTLYNFSGTGGAYLDGGLVQIGNSLYGAARYGGQTDQGVIYKLNLPTATRPLTFQVLHSFSGSDGAYPLDKLLLGSDKNLYGTTSAGGSNNGGSIFKIVPSNGAFTVLHLFNSPEGNTPYAGLIEGADGFLYGTTYEGGIYNNAGTVFRIRLDSSLFTTLHSFNYLVDGGNPSGALLQASDGMLYGTTYEGGVNDTGTVFQLSANGSVFHTIYTFGPSGTDSAYPEAGLVEGLDGNLYGTTAAGGISPGFDTDIQGTVFSLPTQLPIVSRFSPGSGSASAGTVISINGVNLAGASAVTIGGVSQTIQSATATWVKIQLDATTPTGSFPILVTTPNGTATSAKKFSVGP